MIDRKLIGSGEESLEGDVVSAFQRGEDWAYSRIYSRFRKSVLKYVSVKVRDEEVAQDITQEVFLKIYRFRGSYRQESASFTTWLWAVARNTIADFHRGAGGTSARSHDDSVQADELPSALPDAEAMLDRKLRRRLLLKLGGRLTRMQRRVLWLRIIYQLSYQEIARRLGLSLTAVKCLAYRSRQTLNQQGYVPILI